jgi:hypothetical protein
MKKIIITIQPQGTVDVESKTCKKGSSVFFFFLGGGGWGGLLSIKFKWKVSKCVVNTLYSPIKPLIVGSFDLQKKKG